MKSKILKAMEKQDLNEPEDLWPTVVRRTRLLSGTFTKVSAL